MNHSTHSAITSANVRAPANSNRILAMLPPCEYLSLLPELEWVHIPKGRCIYEFGSRLEHVYFPTQGVVWLLYLSQSGASSELAVVGDEGMIGVTSFMGSDISLNRALVQVACSAYRLPARLLKAKFSEGGPLQHLLLRYTESLIIQISLTAVCNLHHTVEKQLCRWLLQTLDRVPENQLRVTQELIANLLGVRRQGVTEAVRKLEKRGLIASTRGAITVMNYRGLLAHACECYEVVQRETNRLLPVTRTRFAHAQLSKPHPAG